ncbi:hypothetical protein [Subtercola vilae]|uniref:hypothetical protein n=1 Tax=Subtercola vilae TaxID=2056433 RepID=UPI0010AAA775|nr:hypothetical protein [Subtercola vilae]
MSNMRNHGNESVQAVAAFHTWHSIRTYNPNQPGIDPWMRDVLVSLQGTLQVLAQTQNALAEESDRQSSRLDQIERWVRQQQ